MVLGIKSVDKSLNFRTHDLKKLDTFSCGNSTHVVISSATPGVKTTQRKHLSFRLKTFTPYAVLSFMSITYFVAKGISHIPTLRLIFLPTQFASSLFNAAQKVFFLYTGSLQFF